MGDKADIYILCWDWTFSCFSGFWFVVLGVDTLFGHKRFIFFYFNLSFEERKKERKDIYITTPYEAGEYEAIYDFGFGVEVNMDCLILGIIFVLVSFCCRGSLIRCC